MLVRAIPVFYIHVHIIKFRSNLGIKKVNIKQSKIYIWIHFKHEKQKYQGKDYKTTSCELVSWTTGWKLQ